jgi:small-conductance mechanosensitive channel
MRRIEVAALAAVLFLARTPGIAQGPPEQGLVQVNHEALVTLKAAVGPFTPAARAQAASRRLQDILNSRPEQIKVGAERVDIGWLLTVNGQPVLSVTDADARSEGATPEELARLWRQALQVGLERAARVTARRTLGRRILMTMLAVVITLCVLWLLRRIWRQAVRILERHRGRLTPLRLRDLEVVSSAALYAAVRRSLLVLVWVAGLLTLTAGLLAVFSLFPATRAYAHVVFLWVWEPLAEIVYGFFRYLPNLCFILVIVFVTRLAMRGLGFIFEQAHRGAISLEPWVPRDVARPTGQIAKMVLLVLALFFIAPLIPGTGTRAAGAISVVLGLMVSFGSTSTVGNLIAGVVLTYMRPFRVGDRVKLGETTGDVTERRFLYTKILTIKNEEVIVPSLVALGGSLINYSARAKTEGLILHTSVTIGYAAPWRKVHELLIRAADRTAHLLKEPRPFVLQTALNDFYVTYQLNAYTDCPNQMAAIYAELHQNIQDSFNEGGVEIMSPHYYQLRDGNATTIPAQYLKDYQPPRFLVSATWSQAPPG